MRSSKVFQRFGYVTALTALSSLAVIACSDDDTGTPGTGGSSGSAGSSGSGASGGTGGSSGTGGTSGTAGTGGTGGTAGGGGTGGTGSTTKAKLRVIHASPGAPAVDIYPKGATTGQPVINDLAYGSSSTYLEFDAGPFAADIRAGTAPITDAPVFTTPDVALEAGKTYSVIAAGALGSTDDTNKFRVLPIVEDFTEPTAGNIAVRVVHAGTDAPTVGVDVGNDNPAAPEIASLARFADTGTGGVALPASTALQLGIGAGGNRATAFTTPDSLATGTKLLVIATGLLTKFNREETGFQLFAVPVGGNGDTVVRIKQNPVVWALHAAPAASPVQLWAGNIPLVPNFNFGDLSPIQVPPSTTGGTIDVFTGAATGTTRPGGDPTFSATLPPTSAGESYLGVARFVRSVATDGGAVAEYGLISLTEAFDRTDATKARVRAVHAGALVPAVDVGPVDGAGTALAAKAFPDLQPGTASAEAGLSLDPGALTIGASLAGDSNDAVAAKFQPVTLTAGQASYAVVGGSITTQPAPGVFFEALELFVVTPRPLASTTGLQGWKLDRFTRQP